MFASFGAKLTELTHRAGYHPDSESNSRLGVLRIRMMIAKILLQHAQLFRKSELISIYWEYSIELLFIITSLPSCPCLQSITVAKDIRPPL